MKVVHYHFTLQPKDSSKCWNLTKVLRILLFMLLCVLKDTKCHLRVLLDFRYMPNMSGYIQYFLFNDIHMGLSLWWQIIYRVFMRATSQMFNTPNDTIAKISILQKVIVRREREKSISQKAMMVKKAVKNVLGF